MVKEREKFMQEKNINALMTQFSDDATFINSAGFYCADKNEIEEFHRALAQLDSISYYYKAGNVHIRFLDSKNALVYYPWEMDWYYVSNPNESQAEVGLMTISAQKRIGKWWWVAITNQHTAEYFDDLTKHRRK
jgi:hypothetical protein